MQDLARIKAGHKQAELNDSAVQIAQLKSSHETQATGQATLIAQLQRAKQQSEEKCEKAADQVASLNGLLVSERHERGKPAAIGDNLLIQ